MVRETGGGSHDHLFIGTSGWSYRAWRNRFYPPGVPANRHLAHYAGRFNAVETNSTAYGLPTVRTVEHWREQLPAGFRTALKMPQSITHVARLRDCGPLLQEFIARVRPLGAQLGPLLVQLPPSLTVDAPLLRDFLTEVRSQAMDIPMTVEFRHASWYRPQIFAILTDADVACCLHDMPGSELTVPRTAGLLYIRFHGTAGRYSGSYGAARLTVSADMIGERLAKGRDVYAFFNNTMDGEAVDDADLLRALISGAPHPGRML